MGQLGAHCLGMFPCPANILLWMPETGRKTRITQNADASKMGSGEQSRSLCPRGPSGPGGPHTTKVPTQQPLPSAWNRRSAHPMGNAGQRVLCHVGGQKHRSPVYTSVALVLSDKYLLFIPFVLKPDSLTTLTPPTRIHRPTHIVSFCLAVFLLSSCG